MKNLFTDENKNRPKYSLFPTIKDQFSNNNPLTYLKRFSFINLFISFQRELNLRQETLYLCINIFDRYIQNLSKEKKISEDLYLVALTCLIISSKNEEIYPPYLKEFLDISRYKCTERDIILKEDEILTSIDFEVLTISPYLFLKLFCQYNATPDNILFDSDNNICFSGAQFFLEICQIEPKFCEMKPSLQAAICLYLSRKFLLCNYGKCHRIWTYELAFKTNYSEIQIKKNVKIAVNTINNFFGNIYTKNFMAIPLYIKYYTNEYLRVSVKLKKIILGK